MRPRKESLNVWEKENEEKESEKWGARQRENEEKNRAKRWKRRKRNSGEGKSTFNGSSKKERRMEDEMEWRTTLSYFGRERKRVKESEREWRESEHRATLTASTTLVEFLFFSFISNVLCESFFSSTGHKAVNAAKHTKLRRKRPKQFDKFSSNARNIPELGRKNRKKETKAIARRIFFLHLFIYNFPISFHQTFYFLFPSFVPFLFLFYWFFSLLFSFSLNFFYKLQKFVILCSISHQQNISQFLFVLFILQ